MKFRELLNQPMAAEMAKAEAKYGREDLFHLSFPTATELGEFGKTEFKNGIADIRRALIEEGWFGQSATGLGWELPRSEREERHADNPLLDRSQGSDLHWTRPREEQAQELDFDR